MISPSALQQLKDDNPVDEIAARFGVHLRRKAGAKKIGPCPLHSSDLTAKGSTSFECDRESWVCAVCADGGDVIRLVMLHEGIEFLAAIEWLGGARQIDPVEARRRESERAGRRLEQEKSAQHFREQERRRLFDIWRHAVPIIGSSAERYLQRRHLVRIPVDAKLRCVESMPYYASGAADAKPIHHGPAMVAAILRPDGTFGGLHFTYLDLDQENGKLALKDPENGEFLPAKKMRGSKDGGRVELTSPPMPRQLFLGEGIETTLAVWLSLAEVGRDLSQTAFWAALDLGNLAGRAKETVPHPTLKDRANRTRRVPGPLPDMTSTALPIPESVTDLVLLGDGDSDPFLTRCALARAGIRYAREGRSARAAWAPEGSDFCDLLKAA